jgi:hypothetical protein
MEADLAKGNEGRHVTKPNMAAGANTVIISLSLMVQICVSNVRCIAG